MLTAFIVLIAVVVLALAAIIAIVFIDERHFRKNKDNLVDARAEARLPELRCRLNKAVSRAEVALSTSTKTAEALTRAKTALDYANDNPRDRIAVYAARAAVDAVESRVRRGK